MSALVDERGPGRDIWDVGRRLARVASEVRVGDLVGRAALHAHGWQVRPDPFFGPARLPAAGAAVEVSWRQGRDRYAGGATVLEVGRAGVVLGTVGGLRHAGVVVEHTWRMLFVVDRPDQRETTWPIRYADADWVRVIVRSDEVPSPRDVLRAHVRDAFGDAVPILAQARGGHRLSDGRHVVVLRWRAAPDALPAYVSFP